MLLRKLNDTKGKCIVVSSHLQYQTNQKPDQRDKEILWKTLHFYVLKDITTLNAISLLNNTAIL